MNIIDEDEYRNPKNYDKFLQYFILKKDKL